MDTESETPGTARRDPDAVALGHRIEEARKNLNRKQLSGELGVHENTLGKWERGETVPTALQLVQISAVCNVDILKLLDLDRTAHGSAGSGAYMSTEVVAAGDLLHVPLFDVLTPARPNDFDELWRVIEMQPFLASFIRQDLGINHDSIGLVPVLGDSVEPLANAGDVVLFDRRDVLVTVEGLHVVRVDKAIMLKVLQRRPGALMVRSRNSTYTEFSVALGIDENFEVLGRCRWAGVQLS